MITLENNKGNVMLVAPKVKVLDIDMNGFCGRDRHPSEKMKGMKGYIIGISHEVYFDDKHIGHNLLTGAANSTFLGQCSSQHEGKENNLLSVYTVVLENGETADFMDFELQAE